jgi:hypothetical protein
MRSRNHTPGCRLYFPILGIRGPWSELIFGHNANRGWIRILKRPLRVAAFVALSREGQVIFSDLHARSIAFTSPMTDAENITGGPSTSLGPILDIRAAV